VLVYIFAFTLWRFSNTDSFGQVLGASTDPFLSYDPVIKSTTAFDQKIIQKTEILDFETTYEKNPEVEYGEEKIIQEGVDGKKVYTYLLTYWGDEEIDRQLTKTEVNEPVEQVVSVGTKIVWKMLTGTEYGRLKYWYKMRVFATKYDANCVGCTGRTFSGTEVKQGVCATDPKTIPLGTNFYVPGYGICRAEDIGGLIKGKRIDLGFVDASKGNWGASYTDIYLLTNAPQ